MTREDLVRLTTRMTQGPVPTPQKKVYGYQGNINTLCDELPAAITIPTRVTAACDSHMLPTQTERVPIVLRECLAAHIRHLQTGHRTSVIVLQEAVLLARYRVPLAMLYDLTGDTQALSLHLETEFRPQRWQCPSYVRYDAEAPAAYLAQALGDQFIRDD
jgi:hypothetical protein